MRYAAQRYGTWEWLDLEVPLDTDGPEWALSTYGIMYATVAPELGLQKAGDGRSVLEEWGTLIHAETGTGASSRRWTGIVVRSELAGKNWELTIHEFPGYLQGTPIETLIRGVNSDPADLIRQIWQDVQAMPNSWHGVTVTGSTPVRLGTDSDDKAAIARATMDARKQTLDTLNKSKNKETSELQDLTVTLADELALARAQVTEAKNTVNTLISSGAPKAQIEAARLTVVSRQATLTAAQTAYTNEINAKKSALKNAKTNKEAAQKAYDAAKTAYDKAKTKAQEDGGAYEIRPEDTPDAMQSLINICDTAGVEWTTTTRYSNEEPILGINVHYPAAGSVRNDLIFEQGVNIISELTLVRDGEDYANAAIGVGSGEGDKAVRASIASTSPRMRRVTVHEDRSLKKQSQLLAAMRKGLKSKSGEPYVAEIRIVATDMVPMFSWNVGDHIVVCGEVPHYGWYSKLHRIISWKMIGDNQAELRLELSTTN